MSISKMELVSELEKLVAKLKLDDSEDGSYYPLEQTQVLIRQYRRTKKVSRGKFASVVGISPGCLKAIEMGKPGVRMENLKKVLNAIGRNIYIR